MISKLRVKELVLGADALAVRRYLISDKTGRRLRKRDVGSPVPAKSTLNAQTLPSASRPRLTPLAAVPANPLGRRPLSPPAKP